MPRGVTPTTANLFKGLAGNKMIDQMDTEKFRIVYQSRRVMRAPNNTAATLTALTGEVATGTPAGTVGSCIMSIWIPGKKFGRQGVVKYENNSNTPMFFDYSLVALAYDIYGTPQLNNVAKLNEGWIKLYFKDA